MREAERIIATLVRGAHNRDGDLHLTYVQDAVDRLPQPHLVWEAVLAFLGSRPDLTPTIVTATRKRLSVEPTKLPARAQAMLGLGSQTPDPETARHVFDEFPEPVTLTLILQP